MDKSYLLLWLEAPLQSWGADSLFFRRDTLPFPTKSGVLGLLACSAGLQGEQVDFLKQFRDLHQDAVSYSKPESDGASIACDFHMVGSGYQDTDSWETLCIPKTVEGKKAVGGGTKLTYRYYIQNGIFAVVVECPTEWGEKFESSLKNPVFDIYLGRKNCVPTDFVFRGNYNSEEEALSAANTIAKEKGLERQFMVRESPESADDEKLVLHDVPLQFGEHKKYTERTVYIING